MRRISIAVTGANGQLGSEFRALAATVPEINFLFLTRDELSITDEDQVAAFFTRHRPDFCINCAAYTAVDKAEGEPEAAFSINAKGVGNLSKACALIRSGFIHISTDYVFDGGASVPYREHDSPDPQNVYGLSKYHGELEAIAGNPDSIIIRTSWVYSPYGTNFVKTILRLMNERESINVVDDQTGSPTYAADLARACLSIVRSGLWKSGVYHYSNQGSISWFRFAEAIREYSHSECRIHPIPSSGYPTPARRPSYSLLDCSKIKNTFALTIPEWNESLMDCLKRLNYHY